MLSAALAGLGIVAPEAHWLSDERVARYRNRIRLQLEAGIPRFFNPHKLHDCAVVEDGLRELLLEFVAAAPRFKSALGYCSHLELRAPDADGVRAFCLYAPPSKCAAVLAEIPVDALPSCVWSCVAWPAPDGIETREVVPTQRWTLHERVYARVPITGFMQVNCGVNQCMVRLVRELCTELGCRSFLDLFCGAGNLSLPLLEAGLLGAGIEADRACIDALHGAAREQSLDASQFISADARNPGAWLQRLQRPSSGHDFVIADPPRAGLRELLPHVSHLAQRYLLMCYCNSESMARDLKALSQEFELRRLWALDMFPQTAHVEGVALLVRRGC
ncbi:MAG: hypothetical protein RJA70_3388 [Pseudomonadota bacterium]